MSESVAGRRAGSSGYFLLLVLVNMMWAFQYTGARIATRRLGSVTVTLLPMAMATVFLGLLLFSKRGARAAQSSKERSGFGRRLFEFVALGLGGCFVGQFCLTSGVSRSLASNASVITLVIPVLTAFLATLLVGEKMSRLLWVSCALAIGGVLLVSDVDWRTVHIFRGKYLAGNALILVGCCGSAFYNAFSKRLL